MMIANSNVLVVDCWWFIIYVAVAGEIQCQFYSISSSDLMSSWVGETEKYVSACAL